MEHDIPAPGNPAVVGLLKSDEMRALVREVGEIGQALYRETVAIRTGQLARSARIETLIDGDRWACDLIVGEGTRHGLPHEFGYDADGQPVEGFHDLNQVLNILGSL
ncbi:hypothetical protein ACFYTF_29345 [Nocardia thailandica]|uniref:Uncharacterized protein n=1 Tax=Nocardia thailandica TaxID=257275 RepID=A0ABW6PX33_9NOCA